MSAAKLIKYSARLEANCKKVTTQNRPVIFLSDSKGFRIEAADSEESDLEILYISQSGANIQDQEIIDSLFQVLSKIKRKYNPIIFIWLSTCDLTFKQGKFVYVRRNLAARVNIIAELYRTVKAEIINKRHNSTVIYLPCPDYSIVEWNGRKGHSDPDSFKTDQVLLESCIRTLNQEIFSINGSSNILAPNLHSDVIQSTGRHNGIKYKANYKLLADGIHPKTELAKLWLLRIQNCIRRILRSPDGNNNK